MRKLPSSLVGVLYLVSALFCFASQDVIVKHLSHTYPALQILTIRVAVVLIILLTVGWITMGASAIRTSHALPLLTRGVLAFVAFTSYYLALSVMPLADAAVVFMTAPMFVTLLSIPILGERVGWHRWLVMLIGFSAVVFMLNPGSEVFRPVSALPLISAICYAMIPIITRRVGYSAHPVTMAIFTSTSYLGFCLIASFGVWLLPYEGGGQGSVAYGLFGDWLWLDPVHWFWAVTSATVFAVALVLITQAYRVAQVSTIAPFEYSYLIWAVLLGLVVFGDFPNDRVIAGGILIVCCGLYIMWRERQAPTD